MSNRSPEHGIGLFESAFRLFSSQPCQHVSGKRFLSSYTKNTSFIGEDKEDELGTEDVVNKTKSNSFEEDLTHESWRRHFRELDPMSRYPVNDSSEKSQKSSAISRTRRLTGKLKKPSEIAKPMTYRQQRAAEELCFELSTLFYRRQFHRLDQVIVKVMGDPSGAPLEIVDVQFSRDMQNVTVFWEPPFLPDGFELSERSIHLIDEELQNITGKLRTVVAKRLGLRRAPYVKIKRRFGDKSTMDKNEALQQKLFEFEKS